MVIKKWLGKVRLKHDNNEEMIIMAVMTKDMLANININSNKANDFIRESNKSARKNREMLDNFREIAKMFKRK